MRIYDAKKHKQNAEFNIICDHDGTNYYWGIAKVADVHICKLKDSPEYLCALESELIKEKFVPYVKDSYRKMNYDFDKLNVVFLIMVWSKVNFYISSSIQEDCRYIPPLNTSVSVV